MEIFEKIVLIIIILGTLCICIFLPFSLIAEKRCLEAGYPHTSFTYDFDIYCSTLQGDVSIKLEKQP